METQRETTGVVLRIDSRRFLDGCWGGVNQRTAVVDLLLSGEPRFDAAVEARLRARALSLCPEEPFFGMGESDWPTGFLVTPAPGEDPIARTGAWVVALTVAILRWGRDPVWRGQVLQAESHRLQVAIPWWRQEFFDAALSLALAHLQNWMRPEPAGVPPGMRRWLAPAASPPAETVATVREHFGEVWEAVQRNGLSPYTLRILHAGAARGMPFDVLQSYVQLGQGANAERFDMTFTKDTGWIAAALAKNKAKTVRTLSDAGIPVPRLVVVGSVEEAHRVAADLGWPVVIKPPNLDMGIAVVPGIRDPELLRTAYEEAARRSPSGVIVEKHVEGLCYRLLVVRDRLLMTVRRDPAAVTGDGSHSIEELVRIVNTDPRRGQDLTELELDDDAVRFLAEQDLTVTSVPAQGKTVELRRTPYVYTGGTTTDVSGAVHPDNRMLAERAARIVGLDIAGVDFLTIDISRSWRDVGGVICEVNSQPALSPNWAADPRRDLEGQILERLLEGRPVRIPTAAIVGDGARRVAELLHGIWTAAGAVAGVCTSDGVRIGPEIVASAELTGVRAARAILIDPAVCAGVFELRVDSVLAEGHPCDGYDAVAVLDSAAAESTHAADRARDCLVLDAGNPTSAALCKIAAGRRVILVDRGGEPSVVAQHRRSGGAVVSVDARNQVSVADGNRLTPVGLWSGEFAALFAVALAFAHGIDPGAIRTGLSG